MYGYGMSFHICYKYHSCITPGRRQSKTLILSTNVDKKSLETEFLIAIMSPNWRQMTIKNTVSCDFFNPRSSAVLTHCQMNKNTCSNQEIHTLFEHGFKLKYLK